MELQTLLLRDDADRMTLNELDFRTPSGPVAQRLRGRLQEFFDKHKKLGKRRLGELRGQRNEDEFFVHLLVSWEGDSFALRATLICDESYVIVPVLEPEERPLWNKQCFEEVERAIQNLSASSLQTLEGGSKQHRCCCLVPSIAMSKNMH